MDPVIASYLAFTLVLLGVGMVLSAGIVYLLARALVMPPRMTDGKAVWVLKRLSPGDLGLPFEEAGFDVRDSFTGRPLRIAAWWIPHPQSQGRCVIFLHGYADAKVGAIAWAPTWHALGWNILAIDLRAHGESGGRFCTGGYFERDDVGQVIDLLRARLPEQTRRLALFGASMGSAVAVAVAAQRDDVDAIVLDSPVPDFSHGAMIQMGRLGAPGGALRRLSVRVAQWITGARFDDVRMLNLLPRLNCPALIIAPERDALLDGDIVDRLRAAMAARPDAAAPHVYWQVADTTHLMPLRRDPAEYRRRLSEFLDAS
jgi:uncharacterized protein